MANSAAGESPTGSSIAGPDLDSLFKECIDSLLEDDVETVASNNYGSLNEGEPSVYDEEMLVIVYITCLYQEAKLDDVQRAIAEYLTKKDISSFGLANLQRINAVFLMNTAEFNTCMIALKCFHTSSKCFRKCGIKKGLAICRLGALKICLAFNHLVEDSEILKKLSTICEKAIELFLLYNDENGIEDCAKLMNIMKSMQPHGNYLDAFDIIIDGHPETVMEILPNIPTDIMSAISDCQL